MSASTVSKQFINLLILLYSMLTNFADSIGVLLFKQELKPICKNMIEVVPLLVSDV
jgi:hypothetical protein